MKIHHLLWLFPILLCCTKKKSSPTAPPPPFKFATQYDSILTAYPVDSFLFIFSVNVQSGAIDTSPVTYSISGLPAGVNVTPSSMVVTRLLGGNFKFSLDSAQLGTDTLDFTITNKETGAQKHKIILHVVPFPDNAPLLAGTYNGSYDYCTPIDSLNHFAATVTAVPGTPYEIKIANLKNFGSSFVVTAWVSNIIRIPVQTIGGHTIWGTGSYTKDSLYQLTINDTLVTGTDTEKCTVHLHH